MRSGVRFTEDYNDPTSDVVLFDRASGWKPRESASGPRTIREFILTTQAVRRHGEAFEYRSLEIELAAWVCEAVTGLKFPELTGRLLWSRIGAESDASFTVDSAGSAIADGGFSATLRDYGRFGLLFLNEGRVDGRPVVPRDWVMECRHGGTDHFRAARHSLLMHYPRASYSNQWWVLDRDAGLMTARGANGQLVYIDLATSNERSGRAILARERQGDTGSYHYVDNLARAIRYVTRQLVDLIPKIYDTQRIARIIGIDGETGTVRIDPMQQEPVRKIVDQAGIVIEKIYNPSVGKYDVAVTTGPSYATKRQEAMDAMGQILQANPNLWQVAGDLFVKNMDWPGAQEISKRLQKVIDPKLLADEEDPALQASSNWWDWLG